MVKSGYEASQAATTQIKDKEIENIKLKCSLEYEKKCNKLEHEYKEKLNNIKKEMRKMLPNMKQTYDEEIQVYKK